MLVMAAVNNLYKQELPTAAENKQRRVLITAYIKHTPKFVKLCHRFTKRITLMSPRFLTTVRQFLLPTLAVLGLLYVCPSLPAQSPAVADATSTDQAAAHNTRAKTLEAKYQWTAAIAEYQAAYAYDKTALPKDAAIELNNIGFAYHELSQYDKALSFYQQALPIQKQVGDRAGEARALYSIGSAYYSLSQSDKALIYFQQALPIRKQEGDRAGEARTLFYIGLSYDSLSQYDKALNFYQQALPVVRQVSNRAHEATTLCKIGADYSSLSQYNTALTYFQQANVIQKKIGDTVGAAKTLDAIRKVQSHQSQKGKADAPANSP